MFSSKQGTPQTPDGVVSNSRGVYNTDQRVEGPIPDYIRKALEAKSGHDVIFSTKGIYNIAV
jgi:hypothetical protein